MFLKKKGPIDVPGSLILLPMFAAHPYNHFCTEYPPPGVPIQDVTIPVRSTSLLVALRSVKEASFILGVNFEISCLKMFRLVSLCLLSRLSSWTSCLMCYLFVSVCELFFVFLFFVSFFFFLFFFWFCFVLFFVLLLLFDRLGFPFI